MESNYVRADNSNLPEMDAFMVALFFKNNADYYAAELKNVKTAVSARESYGDDGVGYVQLKRDNGICTVKYIMCPEHKVRTKPYNVTLVINENEREIVSCECHDCAALAGGCKHAVAFLMWVHRRSEDPSSTSIECYWKKPTLSRVGTTIKFLTIDQMTKNPVPHLPSTSAVYDEFIVEAKKRKINNCELLKYQDFEHTGVMKFSVHHYLISQPNDIKNDVVMILEAMKSELSWEIIKSIEKATRQQNKSNLWYEMRYGCIRASKAHEVSVCHTPDGTLVATIMGAKIPDTVAMKRGRNLEFSVRKQVRVASLRNATSGQHLCGATLLTEEYASTAAHCVVGDGYLLQFDNFCGEPPKAKVLEIVVHELYDRYSRAHDIALLRVERVDLPGLDESILPEHSFGAGGDCTVYGYGVKDVSTNELSGTLLTADVRIVSLDECTQALGPYMAPDINAGMMCAIGNGTDTCEGDSGGPLMCRGLSEGISSHGLGCGAPGVPAVYTSIRAHLPWLRRVMQS